MRRAVFCMAATPEWHPGCLLGQIEMAWLSPESRRLSVQRFTRPFPIAAILLGGALLSGCTDEATAPRTPEFAVTAPESTKLTEFTYCTPQPYAVASGVIGPTGGMLKAGKHRLWVPAGALKDPVLITMEIPSGYTNRVLLRPAGLKFNRDYLPHLVMSYTDCSVSAGSSQKIAYINERLGTIEPAATDNDPLSMTVDGTLAYFPDYLLQSTYAVVY